MLTQKKTEESNNYLVGQWNDFTNLAMGSAPVDREQFRIIARDTYSLLSDFDHETHISKSVATLLGVLAEFSAYAFFSSDEKGMDPIILHTIALALWCQFTEGFENYGSVYPVLRLGKADNFEYINLDSNDLLNWKNDDIELPF